MCSCVVRIPLHRTPFSHTRESVPISLTRHRRPYPPTLCLCGTDCWLLLFAVTTAWAYSAALCADVYAERRLVPSTEMKYCKVIALYAAQTGEVHGTALIFSLFHRVAAWLLNPCLTVWIIRKRGINEFNVYTRSKCWLLTRSEKNNEMP